MTTEVPAAAARRSARLDPRRAAVRRAARVTVAACLAFYPLRYGLDDPTGATYALFTTIALGALSDVQGAPPARTRSYLAALAAGAVLVTAGTLAAADTAVAVAGMLVIGFGTAYAGVGGPRVTAVATGLQLFYILPCFPPFAPDTLDQRLAGLLVGGVLMLAADRLLWPEPGPPPPDERLAVASERIAAHAGALRAVLRDPAAVAGAELAARRAARDAADRLRLADIPLPERPLGLHVRDRSLLAAHAATRLTADRLGALADLLAEPGRTPHPRTADLVGATADVFAALAGALHSGSPAGVGTADLDEALARYRAERGRHLTEHDHPAADLRAGLAAVAVAEDARTAVLAAGGFLGVPPPAPAATPPGLWFLHTTPAELLGRRLAANLTPRSVHLQNAARLAFGLALARVVAGVLDLAHGFWVLLATLSLMRTSARAGRAVLGQAFAGTVLGALVAGAVLTVVGPATDVYAWALPPMMVLAFAAGPVFGVGAAQAGFTVVVAMLYAQLAPTDWQLAEVRLTDVLVGGLVGAVIGAAVWPRGGGGEVRRAAAGGLRAGAATVRETIGLLAGDPDPGTASATLYRSAFLFEHAYIQFRTEPGGPRGPDWLLLLGVVHRIDNDATVLRARHGSGAPPGPAAAAALRAAAAEVAAGYTAAADAIAAGRPPTTGAAARLHDRLGRAGAPAVTGAAEPALRLLDGWGWLHGLADDLGRIERVAGPG